jgi:ribosomal protein L11 methyltransferase
MALLALERSVFPGCGVVDVGTGSGMLAIATRLLGAATAFGLDVDCAALKIARGNFQLNDVQATLICGSAECTRTAVADIAVANISGSVLLAIWDDLVRITRPGGKLIVTGFTTSEAAAFRALLANCEELQSDDWSCLCATFS